MPDETALEMHRKLVRQLGKGGFLPSPLIAAAFDAVPRHCFLPGVPLVEVYRDAALITSRNESGTLSSCSQPSFIAMMMDQVGAERGKRILEIGSGTGYNAVLMSHTVGESGCVVTLDIDQELVAQTRLNLRQFGFADQNRSDGDLEWYCQAGWGSIRVLCQDGAVPVPNSTAFDGILVTASGSDIAACWIEQLGEGGRLVVPLRLLPGFEVLVTFVKRDGGLISKSIRKCNAVRMRGEIGDGRVDWSGYRIELNPKQHAGQSDTTIFHRDSGDFVLSRRSESGC